MCHDSCVTDVIDEFSARGLIAQTTDLAALRAELATGPTSLYIGFDPTAPSLHIGHLMQAFSLRRFQLAGHRPVALVGGATGLIGDPKPAGERTMNDSDVVAEWGERIRGQLTKFLDFGAGPTGAVMADNYAWTQPLSTLAFLRDVGKHFSVNRMLDRDAVATRLAGPGISFTEFSYVLLQSLDYLELFRRHDVRLQVGGSDQWGNITAGIDLIRRVEGVAVHALTTPLLAKSDGTKFGKTEGGAVWLDPEMTSPYAFYQYWVNADDADVPGLLNTFSFRPTDELEELNRLTVENPAQRAGQRALADELTSLVHGPEHTQRVVAAAAALFGRGALGELDAATLTAALQEAPNAEISAGAFPAVVDLFVAVGLCASRNEARRTVTEGGAYMNNERIADAEAVVSARDVLEGGWIVLRRGKRTFGGVHVSSV